MSILPGRMTGTHYVRVIRPAFQQVQRLMPKMRDRAELRRQSLKLRFWNDLDAVDESGNVVDMNWTWIKSYRDKQLAELRIDDEIAGLRNLRVLFWVAQTKTVVEWAPEGPPVSMIWILGVVDKKKDDLSKGLLISLLLRRQTVIERFYNSNFHI